MEPQDKLKSLIDKSRIDTSAETNDRILGDALQLLEQRRQSARTDRFLSARTAGLAIAAALLIALGFFAARLTAPAPLDAEQLRAAIEQSLAKSIDSRIDARLDTELAARWQPFEDRFTEQIHADLKEFGTQTIAATDQRMMELIQLIEKARRTDRIRVENALRQIEQDRYEDKLRLANGIYNLAAANTLDEYQPQRVPANSLFDAKRNHQ